MKWRIFCVGKPSLDYAQRGVAEYERRLRHYTSCELVYLKSVSSKEMDKRSGSAPAGHVRIVLDERGELLDTRSLAQWVAQWQLQGSKAIDCLIGGADGHDAETRESADLLLALSRFTLQHELALLVWLEQVYRVHTLLRGEPYHR